jgi:hypothetical protein
LDFPYIDFIIRNFQKIMDLRNQIAHARNLIVTLIDDCMDTVAVEQWFSNREVGKN